MDIPDNIQEDLKCTNCKSYLSRGPVYLQHDEATVCDRCYTPEHSFTRNKYYETTAKLLTFPCKYQELGCPETVPFVDEAEVVAHEEVCEHRQYVCPVLGSAHCDWLGTRAAMLEHCRDQHLDNVLENPCSLTHDISRSSLNNYILLAFQLLFLLHTKVCVATGKIYHSVRFLGTSEEAAKFFYRLNIKQGNVQLLMEGQVAPQGCLAIQEDTSVAVNTNNLIEGTTFTVTVKQKPICAGCGAEVTVFLYRGIGGWRCELCAPAKRACENQGCTHTDLDYKCRKHEWYFCQQRTTCDICQARVSRGTLSAHYDSVHQDITGSTWRATSTWTGRHRLVSSVAGTAVCWYTLNGTLFRLYVFIPVSSERLREFRCEVKVIEPTTGHTQTYTPYVRYADWPDWRIDVKEHELPFWNSEFDVVVNINKKN